MIGPRHLTPLERRLADTFDAFGVEDGSSSPCVWAALDCMRASLPPAGPDLVEAEVAEMFRRWDVPSCAQTVNVDNVEE